MTDDDALKGFFIANEDKFTEEQLLKSISRMKKYAKLVGTDGKVHIEDKSLNGTTKLKLFIITRYLGSELGKLKPELGIPQDLKSISAKDVELFLSVDNPNARARLSALAKEGFVQRTVKGKVQVQPWMVEKFLEELESGGTNEEKPTRTKSKTKAKRGRKNKKDDEQMVTTIDVEAVYERIAKIAEVDINKLKDSLLIKDDGTFKFHEISGKSKMAKQKNVILLTGYILTIGFGDNSFKSKICTDVCYNSHVDKTNVKDAFKALKKDGLISNDGKASQTNVIREDGKKIAKKNIQEICG